MATEWFMEGPRITACNCDPGCPCDFNQLPTHDHCEGVFGMRIDSGRFGDVDLSGLHWLTFVRWPGAIHFGNGECQHVIDSRADEAQREAILEAIRGRHGDTLLEIIRLVCPTEHEPVSAPFEWSYDLEARTASIRAGDQVEIQADTLRGIEPPDPYRVIVRIPGGMEYVNEANEAETAQAKRIRSSATIDLDVENGHTSLCMVRRGSSTKTFHKPTVVEAG